MLSQERLELLQFPQIREMLANFTSFSASRELALDRPRNFRAVLACELAGKHAGQFFLAGVEGEFHHSIQVSMEGWRS